MDKPIILNIPLKSGRRICTKEELKEIVRLAILKSKLPYSILAECVGVSHQVLRNWKEAVHGATQKHAIQVEKLKQIGKGNFKITRETEQEQDDAN